MFLDIETLPASQDKHQILKEIFEYKNTKKEQKKTVEEFIESTNFGGAFGRIFCISYALNEEPAQCLYHQDEKEILKKFWDIAKDIDLFIGHSIFDFDLKFIYQRSIILQIKPTRDDLSFARYRSHPIYDIMAEWEKWGRSSGFASLDTLARAMNIPSSKSELDGSKVYEYYQKGKYQDIIKYCNQDVEVTREIYRRITFQ